MSGHGFHVHGPHDHELEHATHSVHDAHAGPGGEHHADHRGEHKGGHMTSQVAMFTAVVATVGAIFGYMSGATQANAGLYKNNAAIKKTEASNQWNYYQAKSGKQNLAELALELIPNTKREFYEGEIKRYKAEKADIKKEAEKLEAEAKVWDQRSDVEIHQHHRWAQATTLLQVSIALAAIALLTRKRWLLKCMYALAAGGAVVGILAMLHI